MENCSQVSPGPNGEREIRSQFATLNVLVPPEAPRILQGDFMLTQQDRDIELDCISIGGKPAAEVRIIAKCDLNNNRLKQIHNCKSKTLY